MAALIADLQSDVDAFNTALDFAQEAASNPACPAPVSAAVDALRALWLVMEDSLPELLACYPNVSPSEQNATKPVLETVAPAPRLGEKPSLLEKK